MSEQNRKLVRRLNEEFHNQGRIQEVTERHFAPDFVNHSAPPGLPPTREGNAAFSTAFRQAFPDYHVTIHDVIAEDDKVVTRKTFAGTHMLTLVQQIGAVPAPTPTGEASDHA